MDKKPDDILQKARSYRNIIATGFRLYTGHFRKFFKASWQMAVLYAAVSAIAGTLAAIKVPEIVVGMFSQLLSGNAGGAVQPMQYIRSAVAATGLVLAVIITFTLAAATVLNKLKEHRDSGHVSPPPRWLTGSRRLMGRTLKGVFFSILMVLIPVVLLAALLVCVAVASPQLLSSHPATTVAALFVAALLVMLSALPLSYVFFRYIMADAASYWRLFADSYGKGLNGWGLLFLVNFISLLLVVPACLVVALPAHILFLANQSAQLGLLTGDPLGMPPHMPALTFCTFLLINFLQFYIVLLTLVHNYYAYGAIEAREQEHSPQD